MTRKQFLPLGQAVASALVFFLALLAAGQAMSIAAPVPVEPGASSHPTDRLAGWDDGHDETLERGASEVEASTPVSLEMVGQIGGVSAAIAASGTLVYVGVGPRLVVLDPDPFSLTHGESAALPAKVAGLALSGTHAYVADGDGGLRVMDVSNPTSPSEVGHYDTLGYARGVALAGNYAYIADGGGGLRVVDVSNPASPSEVGHYDTPGYAHSLAVSNTYAYIAAGYSGLRIMDVSNPTSPSEVGFYDTPGRAYGVTLSGTMAYIAAESGGLRVVDVSDPISPSEVGFYDTPGLAHSVALSGSYAYVADGEDGMRVIDVSNPISLTEADHYDTLGYAYDVALSGIYACVADGRDLFIVDVLDPNGSSVWPFDVRDAVDVAVSGSRAYLVAEGDGLHILDTSNPTNVVEMGFYSVPGQTTQDIVVSDTYAYIAAGWDGLRVIDVLDAFNPVELGFYGTPGYAHGVAVSGTRAYIADGGSGLRVIDVSDPMSPAELGFYDTPGLTQDVAVAGDTVYVADGESGLRVVDVSTPASPSGVGFYDTPGLAHSVVLSGSYAYVADGDSGLRVVDVSNPSSPIEVGFYDTPGEAQGVAVSGVHAYIADDWVGLRVVDVSDPCRPTEVGYYSTLGRAYGVVLSSGYAYIANSGGRLVILRFEVKKIAFSASGHVIDHGGTPIRDVVISAGPGLSTTTGANGYYTLTHLVTGTYTLTPTLTGYTFSPPTRTIDVPPGTVGQDFTGVNPLAGVTIGGPAAGVVHGTYAFHAAVSPITATGPITYVWAPPPSGGQGTPDVTYTWVTSGVQAITLTARNAGGIATGTHAIAIVSPSVGIEAVWQLGDVSAAVAVSGRLAYAGIGSRLVVLDVADPASPAAVGQTAPLPGPVSSVVLSGTRAYVADWNGGLHVVDVSDPASPAEVGFHDTPGNAQDVAVAGDTIYVADGNGGLCVVDMSNPASPSEVGFYDTPGFARGVALAADYAYVADGWSGLRVVDVSTPTSPSEVGCYDTPGYARGVVPAGGYAYVADRGGGLRVIDVSHSTSPAEVGMHDTPGEAASVVVSDTTAYVADGDSGLHVIDVSNPSRPVELGFRDTPGWAADVAVSGAYVYVADTGGGLIILRLAGEPAVTPPVTPCYTLARTHTGQGGDPVASPAHSAACPVDQFHVGEMITLTASPAPGWHVRDWDGTHHDDSAWMTNTVVMPAHPHTTTVNYTPYPSPDTTLSIASGQVAAGASVTLPVTAALPAGRSVRDAIVEVRYDPAVVDATACRVDPDGLFDFALCDVNYDDDENDPDAVRFGLVSISGVTGTLLMANLTFQAVGAAGMSSTLDLVPVAFADPGTALLPVTGQDGEIVITATLLPCYPLTRTHTGWGNDPVAAPVSSSDCAVHHYHAGQVLTLTASPASGWHVDHWSGTGHDLSATITNTTTMPAGGHTISVNYAQDIAVPHQVYLPFILRRYPPVYTASGQVRNSVNEPVAGVTISTNAWYSATTDGSGDYTLHGLMEGSYTLTAAKSGYACSAALAVSVPPDATGQDFTCDQVTYSISGRVTDQDDAALPDVTITAGVGHSASTDSNGEYRLEGLEAGSYTLTASRGGYVCSPASRIVSVPPSAAGENFQCDGRPELVPVSLSVDPVLPVVRRPATVRLALRNQGGAAAQDFWLELYINPSSPPTGPNQWWYDLCGSATNCNGGGWYVEAIQPGQTITLTSQELWPGSTWWEGYFTTAGPQTLYAYVDWWADPPTGWGSIHESDENNNLIGPVTVNVARANRFSDALPAWRDRPFGSIISTSQ
jgi:hypothetical protein